MSDTEHPKPREAGADAPTAVLLDAPGWWSRTPRRAHDEQGVRA